MQTPSNSDLRGIDVSRWQGSIDWQAVRGMAVEIAYIKSSEGADYIDPYFERNYSGAQSAGVKCGFYHFMTAISETAARAQAEYFARVISGKRFQARPAADLPYDRRLSAAAFTRVCAAFLERVEELTGVTPMIYSSAYGAREYLLEPLNKYPLWVANYGVGTPESNPRWARWTGFQYSETGRVAGISTLVDMDWFTDEALIDEHELPAPDEPAKSPYNGEVYYVVQRGDTLTRIAARYGATAAQAARWNALPDANRIYPGQVLRIFVKGGALDSGGDIIHIVMKGETLDRIARRYGVPVHAIVAANAIRDPNRIYPGEALRIPRAELIARPTLAPDPLRRACVVQPGDTLSALSRRYGTDECVIACANGIRRSDSLYAGQVLRVTDTPLTGSACAFTGHYVVQPGDKAAKIAARWSASERDLRQINNLGAGEEPKPGRLMRIRPDGLARQGDMP